MAPESFSPAGPARETSRVSHYDIVRKLGQGGMCAVYLARDLDLGRFVALKFLPAGLGRNIDRLVRFRTEAKAISALNHPHIATIFAIEETEDARFLVLEYLPGGTLRRQLDLARTAGERLPIPQVAEWGLQIAGGLAHAHRHEIVHRDIKASNVLFTEERRVKIADFGLAKILDDSVAEANTASGCLLGTPAYMAPEQARGLPADKRSDVFSLGVLLFEMVAGKLPFHAPDTPSLLHEIVCAPAPRLRELRADVDGRLAVVIERALAKDPTERFQDAGEMARELCPAPVVSGTETITLDAPMNRRRGRWLAGAAATLIAVLAVGGALFRRPASPSALPDQKRIAVLPFTNLGDPADQHVTDALMELVANSLTRLGQFNGALLVTPAADVRHENVLSARDAGRLLGVNLVITGSVEKLDPEHVQVFLNLVDARAVAQLRTETIRASRRDLAALQDGVVGKVARILELALPDLRAGNTSMRAAETHYVEGLGYLRRYDRPQNLDSAIASFQRALAIDPGYAPAHDGAALAYWRRYQAARNPGDIETALQHAARALAADDRLASGHVTLGMIRAGKGQYDLAVQELHSALRLDPHSADAYRELATAYELMGREADVEATYRKAIDLRQDDWWSVKQLGVFYFRRGRYADAESAFRDVIRLTPDSAKAHANLGGVLLAMGRASDAAVEFERSIAIEPNPSAYSNLGAAYFYEGRYADAVAPFEKAAAMAPTNSKYALTLADAYRWTPAQAAKAPAAYRRAIGMMQRELAVAEKDAQLRAKLATTHSALEEHRLAIVEIEKTLRLPGAPADGFVRFRAALVYEGARQRGRALRELDAALAAHYRLYEVQRAPELAALRRDPRFQDIVSAHNGK